MVLYASVGRPRAYGPAAVVVLHRRQLGDVARDGGIDVRCRRQLRRVEGVEDVAQRRDGDQLGGETVGRGVAVLGEVQDGVGERLQAGRRRRHLEPAELRDDVARGQHRLGDRPLVEHAVGGERLRRRRRVDGQRDRRRVGPLAADGGDAQRHPPDVLGGQREADLDPIGGRHGHAHPGGSVGAEVRRLDDDVGVDRRVGVVLDDDGQLEAVAEVEEARCPRSDHQRELGGQVGLGAAELLGADCGDDHHAVPGEVVGERHVDGGVAVGVGGDVRGEQRDGVEVAAHGDRRAVGARGSSGAGGGVELGPRRVRRDRRETRT